MAESGATVLVTGGAGYIGSHACALLKAAGHRPVVFDNLSTGWREAVKFGPLIEGDLLDPTALGAAFDVVRPDAVMHFAALSNVGESVARPALYWRNNVVGSLNLLDAMRAADVRRLVFSSTCATYGEAVAELTEDHPQSPINPYGRTKLTVERMIGDYAMEGFAAVIFRYFNVAGADPAAGIGEQHEPETHLAPLVLDAIAGARPEIVINGADYETPDGTCIRDYLHVSDLVEAHALGLDHLLAGGDALTLNLGTGRGFSVKELIRAAEETTGRRAPMRVGLRRPGDPPRLVCGGARAEAALGWRPRRSTMAEMLADAWAWRAMERYRE